MKEEEESQYEADKRQVDLYFKNKKEGRDKFIHKIEVIVKCSEIVFYTCLSGFIIHSFITQYFNL